ncbi:DUF4142 domain-containing protein [Rariglobus hedericola]|nr:DUF4142 domain-containing protein [Rariglobus hedericola]
MKTSARLPLLITAALFAFSLPASSAGAQETNSAKSDKSADAFSRRDRRFIGNILKIHHTETVIAQLVAERATTKEIKALARQLVADLGEATRETRALAEKKHMPLPDVRSEAGDLKTWNEKKPETLDADYLRRVEKALDSLVDLYEDAAQKSDNPEIAAFAQKLLPSAREQHQRASQIVPVEVVIPAEGK